MHTGSCIKITPRRAVSLSMRSGSTTALPIAARLGVQRVSRHVKATSEKRLPEGTWTPCIVSNWCTRPSPRSRRARHDRHSFGELCDRRDGARRRGSTAWTAVEGVPSRSFRQDLLPMEPIVRFRFALRNCFCFLCCSVRSPCNVCGLTPDHRPISTLFSKPAHALDFIHGSTVHDHLHRQSLVPGRTRASF